jgi:hypothetical protein
LNKSCARPRSHGASSNYIKMESAVSEGTSTKTEYHGRAVSFRSLCSPE